MTVWWMLFDQEEVAMLTTYVALSGGPAMSLCLTLRWSTGLHQPSKPSKNAAVCLRQYPLTSPA